MSSTEALRHGGALDAAIRAHGGRRENWLDLSTGINPAPPQLPEIDPSLWARLPEASLQRAACAAARDFYRAPDAAIVAAPGSQALITLLPHLFGSKRVAILEPTYSEHRASFEAAGHRVTGFGDLGAVPDAAEIVVVVNPNNPDGRLFRRADLAGLRESLAARGGLLVVDEAFMDAEPAESLAPEAGRPGLLIHRSFGKFFGLAGLRLGFALTDPALADTLEARLGPWAVSGPALGIAAKLMGDPAVAADLRKTICRQQERLRAVLDRAGMEVAGSTALFALIRHDDASGLFDALCGQRILTRPFAYCTDWLRIGNPASEAEAERLEAALLRANEDFGAAR